MYVHVVIHVPTGKLQGKEYSTEKFHLVENILELVRILSNAF